MNLLGSGMKLQFAVISSLACLTLAGCAGSYPERVVTKGPLICEANEVCPELSMRWKDEVRDGFKITAEINNPTKYDITQFVFLVDGQPYTYSTINTTQYAGTVSSNSINVPVSFLNSFRNGKEISLKLVTNQGDVERSILKADGQQSSAYLTFLKGYTGQIVIQ